MRTLTLALVLPLACASTALRPQLSPSREQPPAAPFVRNEGQWDARVRFAWQRGDLVVHVERDGLRLARRRSNSQGVEGAVVRLQFVGCAADVRPVGVGATSQEFNYLLGTDPGRWRTGVHGFLQIEYQGLYHGVDLRLYEQRGRLKYDLVCAAGGALDSVRLRLEGCDAVGLDEGALVGTTRLGSLRQSIPASWYVSRNGQRVPTWCRFETRPDRCFGFAAMPSPTFLPLVIDPELDWSTFLGGSGDDGLASVGTTAAGDLIVVGSTESADFPSTPGVFMPTQPSPYGHVCVTRLSADGRRAAWSTYIGGSWLDGPIKAAVAPDGATTIVGQTHSPDYPITPGAFDPIPPPQNAKRGFVTCLAADGRTLVYSTFLGRGDDFPTDVALYPDGSAVVVGWSGTAWPTTPGVFKSAHDWDDAFVTHLDRAGTRLIASTLLGPSVFASSTDTAMAVATTSDGGAIVAGRTWAVKAVFPTTPGAFRRAYAGGGSDVFVTRLDAGYRRLVWSTLLGGRESDLPVSVALSPTGSVVVAGGTSSPDFPTTPGVVAPRLNFAGDGFVTRLDPTGSSLEFSTFLTNTAEAGVIRQMLLDEADDVLIVGEAVRNFPTTPGARSRTYNGGYPRGDAIVVKLDARGQRYVYSSFLGGSRGEGASAAALLASGALAVVGSTESTDFPVTAGAFRTRHAGAWDGFVAIEQLLPTGVGRYGTSSPSCLGPLTIDVNAMPVAGDPSFALACRGAAPFSWGILALGSRPDRVGTPFLGAALHVSTQAPITYPVALGSRIGAANVSLPIPAGTQGIRFFAQFLWPTPLTCPGPLQLTASNALDVVVQ